jgi:peptide/nickel transport system permease protein
MTKIDAQYQKTNVLFTADELAQRVPIARDYGRLLRRHRKGVIGLLLFGVILLLAIGADLLTPYDPTRQELTSRLAPPFWTEGGNAEHWLGTDGLGRDLLSRIIYGARISLLISLTATAIALAIGVVLGLLAGYFRGVLESIIMALVDIQLAFPFMLLALTFMTVFDPSVRSVIIVLALSGWATFCRMVRGQVLSIREREFVLASRALGATDFRLIRRHILPNMMSVIIVMLTINVARCILAEASLSFVGMGVSPQTPSWGGMINEGRQYIWNAWWITTFPGIFLVVTVMSIGLLGDWLRDVADPQR